MVSLLVLQAQSSLSCSCSSPDTRKNNFLAIILYNPTLRLEILQVPALKISSNLYYKQEISVLFPLQAKDHVFNQTHTHIHFVFLYTRQTLVLSKLNYIFVFKFKKVILFYHNSPPHLVSTTLHVVTLSKALSTLQSYESQ